jgi:hypothetical protein
MGGTTPPPPPVPGGHMRTGSMNDLDRKNAIEVMELSDIHHPSCKLSQSRQGSFDDDADDGKFFFRRHDDLPRFLNHLSIGLNFYDYILFMISRKNQGEL